MHARNPKRSHAIAEHINGRDIKERITDDDRERPLDQRGQMVSQYGGERNGDAPILLDRPERRGLVERDAHIESNRDKNGAQEKGAPPRPIDKGGLAESDDQQKEQASRNQEADRRPELGKHAVPGAFAFGRVFDPDKGRSTPFAAKPNA